MPITVNRALSLFEISSRTPLNIVLITFYIITFVLLMYNMSRLSSSLEIKLNIIKNIKFIALTVVRVYSMYAGKCF